MFEKSSYHSSISISWLWRVQAFTVVLWISSFQLAYAKDVRCWVIHQDIPAAGRSDVIITDQGVRVNDLARGYSAVMSAPKWQPVFFADSRKVMCATTVAQVNGGFAARFRGFASTGTMSKTAWKADAESKVCDRKVQVYKKVDEPDSRWKYFACKDLPVNPKIVSLVSAMYGVSDLGQFPLRFQTGHTKARIVLDTISVKQENVDPKVFSAPSNYKKVKLEEVMFAVMDF